MLYATESDYKASKEGDQAHKSKALFRFLIWGIKSGKSFWGAYETVRYATKKKNKLVWVVAPTYGHLEVCERQLEQILYSVDGLVLKHNLAKHTFKLENGNMIQLKSAEWPNSLRGPNVDFIWIDEADFVKDEAWWICKGRTAATRGRIICTTTPNPDRRGWIYDEAKLSGMPMDMPYGVYFSKNKKTKLKDNLRWISHYPSWHFPWVADDHIDDAKRTMPRSKFNTEYGALFADSGSSVFMYIDESLGRYPMLKADGRKYVMGVDLAKYQDFTAITIMDGSGRVLWVDRWTGLDWKLQKARLITLSREWKCAIVLDRSNVGSVIEEDLRAEHVMVHPVDMNSPAVKTDLIQALQVAFEKRNIFIPDPRSEWAPETAKHLVEELNSYSASLTRGGRLSYNAPKGHHDDLVVSLALANWGKMRGLAGGGYTALDVSIAKDEWQNRRPLRDYAKIRRPNVFKNIFRQRHSSVGFKNSSGPFWS